MEKAEDPAIKDELRKATDEAISAGVFGAPAFVVTIQDEPGRKNAKELFWGQDRLDLVEELLAGRSLGDEPLAGAAPLASGAASLASGAASLASGAASLASGAASLESAAAGAASGGVTPTHRWIKKDGPQSGPPVLEYYFDFSSPFAYLASRRVGKVAEKMGAKLVYKPFLLGGLFNAIGTPTVPLFEMPEPKRVHAGADMNR